MKCNASVMHTNPYSTILLEIFEVSFFLYGKVTSQSSRQNQQQTLLVTQFSALKALINPALLVYPLCYYTGIFIYLSWILRVIHYQVYICSKYLDVVLASSPLVAQQN